MAFVKRDDRGVIEIRCNMSGPGGSVVRTVIRHCTGFYPHNEPWLSEYESLSWVWSSDANGRPAFVRMRDLQLMGGPPSPSIGFLKK
jgi:hypothetical protein